MHSFATLWHRNCDILRDRFQLVSFENKTDPTYMKQSIGFNIYLLTGYPIRTEKY